MKKILIAALLCLPLIVSSPAISQVSVQINIGNPAVRPYPDGVWVPGYYYVEPQTHHRVWRGGDWRHDNGHHYGQHKDKGRGNGHGKGNGKGHGRDN
ncbi:MAG: hypothetical protein ACHQM6_07865 [Candidatus Kapaibacterium sp.]